MMQVVPRWKVRVLFSGKNSVTLWFHDHHVSNVLRQVAALSFSENGLEQPEEIIVAAAPYTNTMVTTGGYPA